MPAKVFENILPTAIAGFAKLVELVKKYAAPMYAPTAAACVCEPPRPREREDHEDEPGSGDDLGEEVGWGRPVLRRDRDRRPRVHQVREDRARDAARHLGREVRRCPLPRDPAEGTRRRRRRPG